MPVSNPAGLWKSELGIIIINFFFCFSGKKTLENQFAVVYLENAPDGKGKKIFDAKT